MESHSNLIKPLKDTLLEYAVLSFCVLFSSRALEKHGIDSIPIFPNHLFEEILEKSKDICCSLMASDVLSCVAVRDRLKWKETSLFRFVEFFPAEKLDLLAESVPTLSTLKLTIALNDSTDVKYLKEIGKAADTLEDLSLSICMEDNFRDDCTTEYDSYKDEVMAEIGADRPLKLKRLQLKLSIFRWFPYALDPIKLTVFDLYHCFLTKSFLKTLADLKQLVHLSFHHSVLYGVSLGELVDVTARLNGLRFLNLFVLKTTMNDGLLNKIMNDMTNLDALELIDVTLEEPNRLLAPKRRLSVLSHRRVNGLVAMSALAGLAHRIGNLYTLEGVMTIISTTPTESLYSSAVKELFDLKAMEGVDMATLIEAEKTGMLDFRSPLRLSERRCSTDYDLLLRMTCQGIGFALSRMHVMRTLAKEIVARNEKTHLANKFKRLLRAYNVFLTG